MTGITANAPSAAQLATYREFAERFRSAARITQSDSPTIEPCQTK